MKQHVFLGKAVLRDAGWTSTIHTFYVQLRRHMSRTECVTATQREDYLERFDGLEERGRDFVPVWLDYTEIVPTVSGKPFLFYFLPFRCSLHRAEDNEGEKEINSTSRAQRSETTSFRRHVSDGCEGHKGWGKQLYSLAPLAHRHLSWVLAHDEGTWGLSIPHWEALLVWERHQRPDNKAVCIQEESEGERTLLDMKLDSNLIQGLQSCTLNRLA